MKIVKLPDKKIGLSIFGLTHASKYNIFEGVMVGSIQWAGIASFRQLTFMR